MLNEILLSESPAVVYDPTERLLNPRLQLVGSGNSYSLLFGYLTQLYSNIEGALSRYKSECKFRAFINIILNFLSNAGHSDAIVYSRSKNYYSKIHRRYGYDWFSYVNYVSTIDAMIKLGFFHNVRGYYDHEKNEGARSRLFSTEKLVYELEDVLNVPLLEDTKPSIIQGVNVKPKSIVVKIKPELPIILKDQNKNWINVPITKETSRLVNEMRDYNELMSNTVLLSPEIVNKVALINTTAYDDRKLLRTDEEMSAAIAATYSTDKREGAGITSTNLHNSFQYNQLDCKLYRVFNNGSWKQGGRFYDGDYQSLGSVERSRLLLNQEPIVEVDYSSLHFRMLYNQLGESIESDPYDVYDGDLLLRKATKLMFLIAINAKSPIAAITAFNNKFLSSKASEKLNPIKERMNELNLTGKKILTKLIDAHPIVQKYMCSGQGIYLQNKDSNLANDILKYFTAKGIPCLCVHDSFIVQRRYVNELKAVMEEFYRKHMNGFSCPVEIKGNYTNYN